ncbi:MAG: LptF/LptG family permease [Ignavibacteria bacterium]|nr:LptF/LptG family permease [Ignavibacteria bacterium]
MILAWYVVRFHIGPFFFGTLTVMFLFLMQFLMNNLDRLLGKGLETTVILQVIALSLSWMVVLAVPMGVLFSTLMAFGGMSAAHEITIVKASGGSLVRMMLPVILFGFLAFYGMYRFNDDVLPDSNHRFKILMQDIQKKKPTFAVESGQFSTQLDGYTILSRSVDSTTGALKGVTIYDNLRQNQSNVVSADTGEIKFNSDFTKLIVVLNNGEIHQFFRNNSKEFRKISFSKHQLTIDAHDFAFSRSDDKVFSRGDREMRIQDMQAVVDVADSNRRSLDSLITSGIFKHLSPNQPPDTILSDTSVPVKLSRSEALERAVNRISIFRSSIESQCYQLSDYNSQIRKYSVEIDKKYSIPFACFVFVFIGCPLGIMSKRGNFGIGAAISLGVYVIYWASLIGGEKLADRNMLSPALGMWMGNIVLGSIGILLTYRMNNESFFGNFPKLTKLFATKRLPVR